MTAIKFMTGHDRISLYPFKFSIPGVLKYELGTDASIRHEISTTTLYTKTHISNL